MSQTDQRPIEFLAPGFDYFAGYDHGAVAPTYFWFRKRQRVLRVIDRHFANFPSSSASGCRVADIGCGDGIDLYLIRKRLLELSPAASLSFVGVDGNPDSLKICELKKAHYGALDCGFVRCDLSKAPLPLGDDAFDLVYCSEVLEHLPEPEKLLREIARILKPRGYFLMTTPNEPNLFQRTYWSRQRRQTQRERELKYPTTVRSENGNSLAIFGHVSVRPVREWETSLGSIGFERIDFERGALVYDVPGRLRGELSTGLRFCLEALLDALPKSWVRTISDEIIGLYRRSA